MKKIIYFVAILMSAFYSNAQSSQLVEDGIFKINLLLPGVSYELGVGNRTTINAEAIIGFALRGASDVETQFGLYPGFAADFRYKKGFYFSLAFGPGVFVNEFNTDAGVLIDVRLGWVIGGRK